VYGVALRDQVRAWVLVEGHSQRSAAKEFEISRDSVARLLAEPAEGRDRRYQRHRPRPAPIREAVVPLIDAWLQENERLQRWAPKQRWTAQRMWGELRRQGVEVAASTVREVVRARREQRKPAFVPLTGGPGVRRSRRRPPGRSSVRGVPPPRLRPGAAPPAARAAQWAGSDATSCAGDCACRPALPCCSVWRVARSSRQNTRSRPRPARRCALG